MFQKALLTYLYGQFAASDMEALVDTGKNKYSIPLTEANFAVLMSGKGALTYGDEKTLKLKDKVKIKDIKLVSPLDLDFGGRVKDIDGFITEFEGKAFALTPKGVQFVTKSIDDIPDLTSYAWLAGSLEDHEETRVNCIFFDVDGGLKAKSFYPRTGHYGKEYPFIPKGAVVFWAGIENEVNLTFDTKEMEVDFDADHIIKSFNAGGKKIGGKAGLKIENLEALEVVEGSEVKPSKKKKKKKEEKKSSSKKGSGKKADKKSDKKKEKKSDKKKPADKKKVKKSDKKVDKKKPSDKKDGDKKKSKKKTKK